MVDTFSTEFSPFENPAECYKCGGGFDLLLSVRLSVSALETFVCHSVFLNARLSFSVPKTRDCHSVETAETNSSVFFAFFP